MTALEALIDVVCLLLDGVVTTVRPQMCARLLEQDLSAFQMSFSRWVIIHGNCPLITHLWVSEVELLTRHAFQVPKHVRMWIR